MTDYTVRVHLNSGLTAAAVEQQIKELLDAESVDVRKESYYGVHGTIPWPEDLDACPECGSRSFTAGGYVHEDQWVSLDDDGFIAETDIDLGEHRGYSAIECDVCTVVLVEDGEIVHDELCDE